MPSGPTELKASTRSNLMPLKVLRCWSNGDIVSVVASSSRPSLTRPVPCWAEVDCVRPGPGIEFADHRKDRPMPITGRCFCGSVTFTCDEPPIMTRACWCRDCRYLAAGNATVNAVFKAEGVKVSGDVTEYRSTADSGTAMRRGFCSKCGTPMFSAADSRPQVVIVRTGTLDDQELARPSANIWTASAPSWACMDTSLTAVEGQPS
jgi:hypothetical protein